jgi:hypothetical protein
MTEAKRRFTVISNDELIEDNDKQERKKELGYHSNPMKWQSESLREDFMRFTNQETGPRFTVEDLLKW